MGRVWGFVPEWIKVSASLDVSIILLIVVNNTLQKSPEIFLLIFFSCPLVALGLRTTPSYRALTDKGYSYATGLLVAVAVIIAFLLFANYSVFRDELGKRYMDGYIVSYPSRFGGDGPPEATANGSVNKFILYASQWVLIGVCIGVPFLTYHEAEASAIVAKMRRWEEQRQEEVVRKS